MGTSHRVRVPRHAQRQGIGHQVVPRAARLPLAPAMEPACDACTPLMLLHKDLRGQHQSSPPFKEGHITACCGYSA